MVTENGPFYCHRWLYLCRLLHHLQQYPVQENALLIRCLRALERSNEVERRLTFAWKKRHRATKKSSLLRKHMQDIFKGAHLCGYGQMLGNFPVPRYSLLDMTMKR